MNEDERTTYRILVRKAEGERPLRMSRCRWVYNINVELTERERERERERGDGVIWTGLVWLRTTTSGGVL
jgi:hypothetical protein